MVIEILKVLGRVSEIEKLLCRWNNRDSGEINYHLIIN